MVVNRRDKLSVLPGNEHCGRWATAVVHRITAMNTYNYILIYIINSVPTKSKFVKEISFDSAGKYCTFNFIQFEK